jgi:hypothetical protein
MLGFAVDDPERFERAALYLRLDIEAEQAQTSGPRLDCQSQHHAAPGLNRP